MTFKTRLMTTQHKIIPGFLLLVAGLVVIAPRDVSAHPMGNFSISHYAAIHIERENIELHYFVDMAEISNVPGDSEDWDCRSGGDASLAPYLAEESAALSGGLFVEIDGKQVELRAADHSVLFTPGAGGLPTMKLAFVYRAPIENNSAAAAHRVHYLDKNFAGHSGWKEIVITYSDGVSLVSSSAPSTDRSAQLKLSDGLVKQPQDLEASAAFSLPPLASAPQAASKPIETPVMASASVPSHQPD